jgi:hypothetical protein
MPDWRVPVTMMSVGPSVAAAGAAGWSEAIAADGKEEPVLSNKKESASFIYHLMIIKFGFYYFDEFPPRSRSSLEVRHPNILIFEQSMHR